MTTIIYDSLTYCKVNRAQISLKFVKDKTFARPDVPKL